MFKPAEGLASTRALQAEYPTDRSIDRLFDRPRSKPADTSTDTMRSQWRSLDRMGRMARHPDLTLQVMCHQISSDYTTFFKRHVRPALRGRMAGSAPRVNLREHSLLLALAQIPSGQSGVDLAFLIRSDPATVSRNISKMCRKGLVNRVTDPGDSRAHLYTLTDEGRALDQAYRAEWRAAIARADREIGAMDEIQFRDRLSAFYAAKDRARAHALWEPGKSNLFRSGMGRPAPAIRPDRDTVRVDAESFFRFYGQQISSDYLSTIEEHLCAPLLADIPVPAGGRQPMTLTHLRTLMCLDFHDHALSGAEIARGMRFDPATVARATDALEAGGYIVTRTSPRDRRRTENILTEAGRRVARRYRASADRMERGVEADFSLAWSRDGQAHALRHILAVRERACRLAELRRLPK